MSSSDSIGTGSTDGSLSSGVPSFLEPRDPSITKPWMRPPPTRGTNLCDRFELDCSDVIDQHLKIYLRIKPIQKYVSKDDCYMVQSRNSLVTVNRIPKTNRLNVKEKKAYSFTHIFDDTNGSQTEIFDYIIRDKLNKYLEGQDFTIMNYGASGSGKTYTLMGTDSEPGIIPRFLEALFAHTQVDRLPNYKPQDSNSVLKLNSFQREEEIKVIQHIVKNCNNPNANIKSDSEMYSCLDSYRRMSTVLMKEDEIWQPKQPKMTKKYDAWVSFAEIYNENIFDLLQEDTRSTNHLPNRLRLVHLANNQSYIKGIRWVYVRNGEEAFAALDKGRCRLHYAHTNINKQSSRSHSIFFLKIVQYNSDFSDPLISTFRLCDLAGSERAKKTGNEGLRLAESQKINSSLHVLERCLASLQSQQDGKQSLPPYRESKLTSLLQNALCGNEAIAMIVNINPDPKFFEESQHVLQFSSIAKRIIGYNEPTREEFRRSRSFSEISERSSHFSLDDSFDSRVRISDEDLKRIQIHYEQMIVQKEKDVRQELVAKFMKMNNENCADFDKRLLNDRKIQAEPYNLEIECLKTTNTEYEHRIDNLKNKIENLEHEIENLKMENKNLKNVIATSTTKETVEADPRSPAEELADETVSADETEASTERVAPSPTDELATADENRRVPFEGDGPLTVKKSVPNLQIDGLQSVEGSKRKLFSRRPLDEIAAENVDFLKTTRRLSFDENSPGAVGPPKLEKPYAAPKGASSCRKKRR